MRHCPTAHVEEDYEMIYKKGGGVLLFVFKAVVLKIAFYVCTILSERIYKKMLSLLAIGISPGKRYLQ